MEPIKSPPLISADKKPRVWVRILKWSCLILFVSCFGAAYVLKDYVRTLYSLHRVPNTNLYLMDYYADYHLDEVRTKGMHVNNIEDSFLRVFLPDVILPIANRVKRYYVPDRLQTVEPVRHLCSSGVLRTSNGQAVFGYNCDYSNDATVIVTIRKSNGESSGADLDLAYLNMNRANLDQTSLLERLPLLFAPYYLLSGMNEHGVAVSSLSLYGSRAPRDHSKPDLLLNTAMRVIPDDARTVEDVIEILGKYNVHFVETPCHLLVADVRPNSAVVDFIDGETQITRGRLDWQVCTNCRISEDSEEECDQECDRYRTVSERLKSFDGTSRSDFVLDTMQSQPRKIDRWIGSGLVIFSKRDNTGSNRIALSRKPHRAGRANRGLVLVSGE